MATKIEFLVITILTLYILSQLFLLLHDWFYNLFLPKINLEKEHYFNYKKAKKEILTLTILTLGTILLQSLPFLAGLAVLGIIVTLFQLFNLNRITKKIIKVYTLKKSY